MIRPARDGAVQPVAGGFLLPQQAVGGGDHVLHLRVAVFAGHRHAYTKHVRHVPVVDEDGDLVGLVTHRDLLRCAVAEESDLPLSVQRDMLSRRQVGEVMTPEPETVDAETEIGVAAMTMFENKYGCLPVVEGARLVGILTEADFVRYLAEREGLGR